VDSLARFDCSSSSSDEEAKKKPRRQKSIAEKEAIRQKLDVCKAALLGRGAPRIEAQPATKPECFSTNESNSSVSASTKTNACPRSALGSSSSDDDDDDLLKSNPIFAKRNEERTNMTSAPSNDPSAPKPHSSSSYQESEPMVPQKNLSTSGFSGRDAAFSDVNAHSLDVATRKGYDTLTDDEQKRLLEAAVMACYRASDPTVATTKDIVAAVEARLGLPEMSKEQKALVKRHLVRLVGESKRQHHHQEPRSAMHPDSQALLTIVDEIFASTAARTGGLQACTFKQFLVAAQAKFSAPFSKECKNKVKERVTYLLKNQGRMTVNASSTVDPSASTFSGSDSRTSSALTNKEKVSLEAVASRAVQNPTASCTVQPIAPQHKKAAEKQRLQPMVEEVARKGREPLNLNTDEIVAEDIPKPRGRRARLPPAGTKQRRSTGNAKKHKPNAVAEAMDSADSLFFEDSTKEVTVSMKPNQGGHRGKRLQTVATAKTGNDNPPCCEQNDAATTRGRKRGSATCSLCSKCPCQFKLRESSGSAASLDFAQSDAAIEKALIKRLLKLEVTTDQYDEQTDAVRRRLKKHRRDMWKKREDMLKAYDNLAAKRKGGQESSRFLPDADEYQLLEEYQSREKKLRSGSIAKIQANIFAIKPTFQPTLTQMMSTSKEQPHGAPSPEAMDASPSGYGVVDLLPEGSDSDPRLPNEPEGSDDESRVSESLVMSHRIDSRDQASVSGSVEKFGLDGASIWDAIRSGNYESSWDRLFHENSDDFGVDHLLGLLGESSKGIEDTDSLSQSSLSTRGRLLVDAVTDRICSNATKRVAIERVCPNWKENVIFAMCQRDETEVSEALKNLREAQAKLHRAKEEILKSIERQQVALGVFEEALQQSLSRFTAPSQLPDREGFFLSQIAGKTPGQSPPVTAKPRQSIESEIGTIIPSPLLQTRTTVERSTGPGTTAVEPLLQTRRKVETAGMRAAYTPYTKSPSLVGDKETVFASLVHCRPGTEPHTPLSMASRESLMASQ
jgi:hypothetical protein